MLRRQLFPGLAFFVPLALTPDGGRRRKKWKVHHVKINFAFHLTHPTRVSSGRSRKEGWKLVEKPESHQSSSQIIAITKKGVFHYSPIDHDSSFSFVAKARARARTKKRLDGVEWRKKVQNPLCEEKKLSHSSGSS
jgi:hypothetical protein